ncbi:MAG: DUF3267 domain-containing protein [Chloroflexi bacterium]|nr:DUF3267 domain-containing protein [Chloroflexota bacterium]
MQPTKQLPDEYQEIYSLDLSKNIRAQLILNGVALILMLVFGWFFAGISLILTPGTWPNNLANMLGTSNLVIILAALLLMPVLHEAAHGLFFWLFTRQRVKFGFKLGYAYAAAPEWYLPRKQYLVVACAPITILSFIGVALMPIMPVFAFPGLLLFLSFNAGGSVGDMFVAWKITQYHSNVLINDQGDSFIIYGKSSGEKKQFEAR